MRLLSTLLVALLGSSCLHAEVTPGEILIAEMNCVACHEVPAEIRARLAPRTAPKFGDVRLTPGWIRDFLTDPQRVKPDTLMPDMLHAIPAGQKSEVVEALVHFLVGSQSKDPLLDTAASTAKINAGKQLYHETGCVQCHAPFQLPKPRENDPAAQAEFASLQEQSVPLAGPEIARKYRVSELAKFLRDPVKTRPSGRMPSMKLDGPEAEAIAMFLLRDQVAEGITASLPGLQYDYYEKDFPELPEFDRLKPTSTGVADVPSLKQAKRKGSYALRWRGNLTVLKDGKYKFYLKSDDGSRLSIDGRQLIDNGGIHPAQERSGEIDLKAGAHSIVLTYFDGGGQTSFEFLWKGPDIEKSPVTAKYFSHDGAPMLPKDETPFAVDEMKAAAGANYFVSLQCAKCHEGVESKYPISALTPSAPAFARMRPRQPVGCLSPVPKERTAKFKLTDRQRTVIVAGLQNQNVLGVAITPDQQVKRTMTTLNCYACHSRDKRGGPEGLRRDYLANLGETDLGDEGRVPPSLHEIGTKLQPSWMRSVLSEGAAVRPYMATRMPQFGKNNVDHLVDAFEKADAKPDAREQLNNYTDGAATFAKHGRKLVGTTGGLSCIACHNFAGNKSLGIPAIDLATTGPRLKWDWFRQYLLDPQSLRPGTRMPAFWPAGAAVNKEVLNGDTEQQIASIWLYLARKNFTDLPAGLAQGKQELVAENEAVIYRNFIEGGGPRAIGVGYPEKANLCFDANDLRITMIWQGPFIDTARHQTGRGSGYEKPLGGNVIKLPPSPAFAVLENETAPWPLTKPPAAGAPFLGYKLDDQQRPTFRYRIGAFEVEDYPIAKPGEVDAFFHRTITIKGTAPDKGQLYLRAAVGTIAREGDAFTVDGKLRLKFPGAKAVLRGVGDKAELLVPIDLKTGAATLVEELVW
jgi:cbb3-type cytochrome oxidase cytochrome c subunit